MNYNNLLFTLTVDFAIAIILALRVGYTARSKGYSLGLWTFLALVSSSITSVFAIFIRPKTRPVGTRHRAKIFSIIGYVAGVIVQTIGLSGISVTPEMTDQQIIDALAQQSSIGSLWLVGAGLLFLVAAVANERVVKNPEAIA
ncbi:MAG: hypothetical protein ACKOWJ_05910 [Micrococcales bacterium]